MRFLENIIYILCIPCVFLFLSPSKVTIESCVKLAYLEVQNIKSDKNIKRFCNILDRWGYTSYFEFSDKLFNNEKSNIITLLHQRAKEGNFYAIRSLVKSSVIVTRDHNSEYDEWLSEIVFDIASNNLGKLFSAISHENISTQIYILNIIRIVSPSDKDYSAILSAVNVLRIKHQYLDYIEFIMNVDMKSLR